MISIKTFLTIWEAIEFCESDNRDSLFVNRELDGKYHVYDADK